MILDGPILNSSILAEMRSQLPECERLGKRINRLRFLFEYEFLLINSKTFIKIPILIFHNQLTYVLKQELRQIAHTHILFVM